jgi:hypothetical protein
MPEAAARWGIVTTVKAPPDQVLAFVAHHRALGPARIWVHFDDFDATGPEAEAAETLAGLAGVEAVRCTRPYWRALNGRRPKAHQYRQTLNLRRVYAGTDLDWLLHIDHDEFLVADRPLGPILAAAGGPMLRVEPWDALHDPGAPEDIFAGRYFRRALRAGDDAAGLAALHGPYGGLLKKGMLGHSAGKCFFRTGIAGLEPAIHSAKLAGRQLKAGAFATGLALLHFHAEAPERWLDRLAYRIEQGAYRAVPELQAFLREAAPEVLSDFYMRTQVATPETLAGLERLGLLRRESLGLRDKLAAMLAARDAG